MFYDEGDQGVYLDPSEPVEETQEAYILAEPATPQKPNTRYSTQATPDIAGVLSDDYDYLFEGEPEPPARFSLPDMQDAHADTPPLNGSRAVEDDRPLDANDFGRALHEAPMMSGALPSSIDFATHGRPRICIHDPRGSFARSPEQSREQILTESDLKPEDFQFHKVIEKIKSKHTRQVLQSVDPSLSRQELFQIYRRAAEAEGKDVELYRPDTPLQEYDSDGLDDSPVGSCDEDVSPCDNDGEPRKTRRKSSCRSPSRSSKRDSVRWPHSAEMRNSSTETLHQSLMHSKPHLSEITPTEAQGHHPSIIPRSPQRPASRASSLSSETRLNHHSWTPEPLPLTEESLARKDEELATSSLPDSLFPLLPVERQPSPFRRPTEPASSIMLSSPLRKPFDSIDASSTKAIIGSPAPTPSQPISRPDTPRPSFATQCMQERSEVDGCPSPAQRHSQPAQIANLGTPSPFTDKDVHMLDTLSVESPTPTKARALEVSAAGASPVHSLPPGYAPTGPAATCPDMSSVFAANVLPMKSPLQPLPGLTLQETLASVLASVTCDRGPPSQQADTFSPRSVGPTRPVAPCLDEPWHETVRVADKLSHYPPLKPVSPSKRPSQQHQRKSNVTRQLSSKKPSDPFAANNDMITFPPPSDSPPLSPLTGIAGQIYQVKRDQRKATAPGRVARRAATGTRAVSTRSPRKAKAAGGDHGEHFGKDVGKRSKPTNLGVKGDGIKVTKTRATGRRVSTKIPQKNIAESEDIPDVPALPSEMEVDSPTVRSTPNRRKTVADRDLGEPNLAPSTPSRLILRLTRKETPQAMDIDRVDLQATPDILEQLERDQWHVIEDAVAQPETPSTSGAAISKRNRAAKTDVPSKTPSRRASRKKHADLPYDMDIDSPQDQSDPQPVSPSHRDMSPVQAYEPDPGQQIPASPSKRTPSKRKPTPSRKKLAIEETQQPKTPSRTPRRKNEVAMGGRLTPRSAERTKERRTPTRRSPRLVEKRKKELGDEVDFEKEHSVM